MRFVLGAARRCRGPLLRHAGVEGGWQIGDDARGLACALRGAEAATAGARAASGVAGVPRSAGAAVRLLLQRHDRQGGRAAGAEPETYRSADPRAHERAHLPLRDLSADPQGRPACLQPNGGRRAMTDISLDTSFARRDLLKGGGALLVGFSLAGIPLPASAARGDVAGPPDPNAIDSWIAIHADNTATVYFG